MMQLKKGFIYDGEYVNKKNWDAFFLIIGVLGAILLLLTVSNIIEQQYDVIGSILLLLASIHFKLIYFIALELILMAGHIAVLLGIGPVLQIAIPILLCIQLLTFYILSGQLNSIYLFIGIVGIAILPIGFSYENHWPLLIGSLCIATYSFYLVYKKKPFALLWGILNSLFALMAVLKLI